MPDSVMPNYVMPDSCFDETSLCLIPLYPIPLYLIPLLHVMPNSVVPGSPKPGGAAERSVDRAIDQGRAVFVFPIRDSGERGSVMHNTMYVCLSGIWWKGW